jgi:hypothetical protein
MIEDRARAGREFIERENEIDPDFFPLKNIQPNEANQIIATLDAERHGWDAKFWFEPLGIMSPDTAWDFFLPTAARIFPHLLKEGFSAQDF